MAEKTKPLIILMRVLSFTAITVLALLAAGLIASRWSERERESQARLAVAQAEVNEIAKQVQLCLVDNGQTRPTATMKLSALTSGSTPYLKPTDLTDPWGHQYQLAIPGKSNPDFDVISYGADGVPGGSGENADIINK